MDYFGKMGDLLSRLEYRVPAGIADRIIALVDRRKLKAAKFKLVVYSAVSVAAGGALAIAFKAVGDVLGQSGTVTMLSLVFSDLQAVSANFGDYFYSLAGSLPVMQIVYFLAAVLALVVFVHGITKNARKVARLKRYVSRHA